MRYIRNMNDFVPLRIISDYSFLQSGLTMERIKTGIQKMNTMVLAFVTSGSCMASQLL